MDQPFFVEEFPNLLTRHLLTARPFSNEKLPAERVWLAVLRGHGHTEHAIHAFDLHRDRWLRAASNRLDPGLQAVVVSNAADHPIIGHANQDHAAGGIGKGAYLTPKLGSARALELDGIAFAKGGQLSEVFFVNIDHCPFLRRVIGDESLHETMGIFDILGVYRRTLALGRIVAQIADGLDGPPHRLTVQIVSKEVICLTEPRPIFLLVFPRGTCPAARAVVQHGR